MTAEGALRLSNACQNGTRDGVLVPFRQALRKVALSDAAQVGRPGTVPPSPTKIPLLAFSLVLVIQHLTSLEKPSPGTSQGLWKNFVFGLGWPRLARLRRDSQGENTKCQRASDARLLDRPDEIGMPKRH